MALQPLTLNVASPYTVFDQTIYIRIMNRRSIKVSTFRHSLADVVAGTAQ
jgi:hypothetical protein